MLRTLKGLDPAERSNTTTVSFIEYPTMVRSAAMIVRVNSLPSRRKGLKA